VKTLYNINQSKAFVLPANDTAESENSKRQLPAKMKLINPQNSALTHATAESTLKALKEKNTTENEMIPIHATKVPKGKSVIPNIGFRSNSCPVINIRMLVKKTIRQHALIMFLLRFLFIIVISPERRYKTPSI
jgi:hypothetical protein